MSILSDAIKERISIFDYAAARGYGVAEHGSSGFKLIPNGIQAEDFSSVVVNSAGTMYYRYSTQKGGSVIDFAMMIDHLDGTAAIKKLRAMLPSTGSILELTTAPTVRLSDKPRPPDKDMQLPPVSTEKFKHIYRYLIDGRKISKNVVTQMVRSKNLYEDAVNHNAVWVGYDYDGKAKFACRRITYDKPKKEGGFLKGDIKGSTKNIGLMIDNHSPVLFLCEAPIDAMSLMTLFELHNMDFNKYSYLAQGGVYLGAVQYHLENQPGIRKIYLCYDNDNAGVAACSAARQLLKDIGYTGQVVDKPPHNKDWNDDLKNISNTIQHGHGQEQQNTITQASELTNILTVR